MTITSDNLSGKALPSYSPAVKLVLVSLLFDFPLSLYISILHVTGMMEIKVSFEFICTAAIFKTLQSSSGDEEHVKKFEVKSSEPN
jgi:hypothetical protein